MLKNEGLSNMRMPDYTKTGDGPVTIFLLHGSYGAKEYWGPQASFLAELGYRVIAWDAPGYGVSPLPKDLTLETMAAAAAHLVNELGTDKNVVLGHSLGGIIAPKVAELSGRVDALIISSAFASLQEMGEEAVEKFLNVAVAQIADSISDKDSQILCSMFAPGSGNSMIDLVREVASRTRRETFIHVTHTGARYDGRATAEAVNIPTLLLGGRDDYIATPAAVERLGSLIPGAEVRIFPGVRHYSFAEVPDQFNEAVTGFLAEHDLLPTA